MPGLVVFYSFYLSQGDVGNHKFNAIYKQSFNEDILTSKW